MIIELDKAKIINFQIYRREDDAGASTFMCALNVMLHNDLGQEEKKTLKFEPTAEELSGLKAVMKPRVQQLCADYDVTPPAWAQ